ncbi:MAG: phage tail tape measure protein [Gemmataceae bacterium]
MSGFSLTGQLNIQLAQGAMPRIRQQIQGGLTGISLDLRPGSSSLSGFRSGINTAARDGITAGVAAAVPQVERLVRDAVRRGSEAGLNGAVAGFGEAVAASVERGLVRGLASARARAAQAAGWGGGGGGGTPTSPAGAGLPAGWGVRAGAYAQLRAGLYSVTGGLSEATREAIAFDKSMTKLAQVSEEPRAVLAGLAGDVTRLSTTLGLSSKELVEQAVTLKQAGYSLAATRTALQAVAVAALAPSFSSMAEITDAAIAARQFGVTADGLKGALGSLNSVSAAYAVEASDLARAVSTAGGSARVAGLSFDELLGSVVAVRDTTRESAAQIATGLKSIFVRLSQPGTVEQLDALGISLRRTREEAEALGDVRLEGQAVPGFEALRRISTGLGRIPTSDPRYAAAVEALGGVRQAGRLIPLVQEFDKAQQAVGVAKAGRTSLEGAAEQAQLAVENRLTKVSQRVLALGRDAVESRGFGTLIEGLERGAVAAEGLARALGPVLPLVGGLAALRLAGAGLGAAGVTPAGVAGAVTGRRLALGAGVLGAAYAPELLGGAFGSGAATSSAGGAVQGAAAGALAGSVFGPVGTAVGGVVGALVGFRSALDSTRDSLSQAAVDKSLLALGHRLTALRAGTNPTAAAGLEGLLGQTRQELERRATSSATPYLGRLDPAAYSAALAKEVRLNVGPRAGELTDAAGTQARALGRANPTADSGALLREFTRTHRELLRSLASVNGVSPADAGKPYLDLIRSAQQGGRLQPIMDRSEADGLRATASLSRLADAREEAARSVRGWTQQGAAFQSLDAGQAARPLAPDVTDPAALARLTSSLGPAGADLLDRVRAGQRLKTVLPSALTEMFSGGPLDGEAAGAKVRGLSVAALGGRANPQEVAGLDAVAAALGGLTPEQLAKAADPTKLADDLLKPFTASAESAAGQLARAVEQRSVVLTDALSYVAQRVRAAGQELDRAGELRLGAVRAGRAAELEAVGGGPVNLPLASLLAPYRQRQARLLAGTGLGGDDVSGITERLARVRGRVGEATRLRDEAAGTPRELAAADALSRLVGEVGRLEQALKDLAEPTQRAAAIQERLNALNTERDARLSFGEKYVFASPEERVKMARGQALAARLNQDPTAFRTLSVDDQRLALSAVREVGGATFGNGRSGEGLRAALLEQLGVVPQGLTRERLGLFDQQARVATQAADAQQAVAAGFGEQTDRFLAGLSSSQEQFLAKLGALLTAGRLADARATLAGATSAGREVGEQVRARDAVSALGVPFSTGADLDRLKVYLPQLREYASGQADLTKFLADRRRLRGADFAGGIDRLGGVSFEPLTSGGDRGLSVPAGERLTRLLVSEHQLDGASAGAISGRAAAGFQARLQTRNLDEFATDPAMVAKVRQALNDAVSEAAAGVTGEQLGQRQRPLADLAGRLRGGLPGHDLSQLTPAAVGTLEKSVETFGKAGSSLDSLDQRAREAASAIERATSAVQGLERAVAGSPAGVPGGGPVVQRRALGGRVFAPHGTDVVNAALSPDEFVVNARQSRANRSLLHRINDAHGVVPGGFVTNDQATHGVSKEATLGHNIRAAFGAAGDRRRAASAEQLARTRRADRDAALAALDPLSDVGFDRQHLDAVRRADVRVANSGTKKPFLGLVRQELAFADAVRQGTAIAEQQLYAAAVVNPGDMAIYGGAAQARAAKEDDDYRRFRQGWVRRFAAGGRVSGTGIGDKIPILAEPGEYILDRKTAQNIGTGALDQARSGGGGGGFGIPPEAVRAMAGLGTAFQAFQAPADTLSTAFGGFSTAVDRLGEAIARFPTEVSMSARVEAAIRIDGDEAFRTMEPRLKAMVVDVVTAEIDRSFRVRLPGATMDPMNNRRLNGG